MDKNIQQIISLVRIRIFTFRDLWMFIIAIILISMTSSALGSIISGINVAGLFLGEEEDVLVITSPGVSTPMTGNVPLSLVYDIGQLEGVKAQSPEVLGVTVAQNLNQRNMVIRGVTKAFINMTPSIKIEGRWFRGMEANEGNTTATYEIVAGKKLAEDQNLEIGSELTLVGTLTAITMDLKICGIIETDTPIDSELIVPLRYSQTLTGRGKEFVSFIRVKVDLEKTTKERMATTINGEYDIPIKIESKDPLVNTSFEECSVNVYSPSGELIKSETTNTVGERVLKLMFGSYTLKIQHPAVEEVKTYDMFVKETKNEFIEFIIGTERVNMILDISFNNKVQNASYVVVKKNRTREIAFSESGEIYHRKTIGNLSKDTYEVTVRINNTWKKQVVNLSETKIVKFDLMNTVSFSMKNITTKEEIKKAIMSVRNATDPVEVIYPVGVSKTKENFIYDNKEPLYFENPGRYIFNMTTNSTYRIFEEYIAGNVSKEILLGKEDLIIKVIYENGSEVINASVSINNTQGTVDYGATEESGIVILQVDVGNEYILKIKDIKRNIWIVDNITFQSQDFMTYTFYEQYKLEIKVYNGTEERSEEAEIVDANVTLKLENETISLLSDEDGRVSVNDIRPGNYTVYVTDGKFGWNGSINVFEKMTQVKISLGYVKYIVNVQAYDSSPIEEVVVEIKLINGTNIKSSTTDRFGKAILIIPVGMYWIKIFKEGLLYKYMREFEESGIIRKTIRIEGYGTIEIEVLDKTNRPVSNIQYKVTNNYHKKSYTGVLDKNGKGRITDVVWGNYTVIIGQEKHPMVKKTFVHDNRKDEVRVIVDEEILLGIEGISLLKWTGRTTLSVVKSGQFLSSYLVTTLQIAKTSLIALVVSIAILSLLSVSSVISFPIRTHRHDIEILRLIGTSDKQLVTIIGLKMALLGLVTSMIGSIMGLGIISLIPFLRTSNIGGLLIESSNDPVIFLAIAGVTFVVVLLKARKDILEYYCNRSEEEKM